MKFFPALLFVALLAGGRAAAPTPASWKFDLGTFTAADPFTPARGAGFDLGTAPASDGRPFYFSVAVPEGNYCVTVTFGDALAASASTVKAESRRLMLESVVTAPGEFVTRSFIVNVRHAAFPPPPPTAPGGSAVVLSEREQGSLTWDDKLTLEFNGSAPHVRTVELTPVEVPTAFLAGDSTVCDQRWEDGASWGQMLPRFFQPGIAIANHAESGETLKSFLSGLRLAKILSQLRAGDYLFIQFGHNDQKTLWPQTYAEAHTTYQAYLRLFIAEARLRGATPVLVTSMQRRTFDAQGKIRNTHGDYPAAVREVAATEHVALIDLERMSVAFYEALGPVRSPLAFGNGGKDGTHHNNYGAYELAKCVAQGIRDARLPLAAFLTADFTGFDPAHPDDPATFHLPASPGHSDLAPRGN
jgi:lysophospholipase L1-like esterase